MLCHSKFNWFELRYCIYTNYKYLKKSLENGTIRMVGHIQNDLPLHKSLNVHEFLK